MNTTEQLREEQLRMIDSAAAINSLLRPTSGIISPRPVTVKVQRPSKAFMDECARILAAKEARERAEFEAHADIEASREFADDSEVTIL
jgi:hypothetical protein